MSIRPTPTRLMLAVGLLGASLAATSVSAATEYGTVVSATPITAQVPIPQQQCVDQPVVYQRPTTGGGALIGGIAGAAIGNSIGGGAGRALATGIGLMAGSAIGNQVEANGTPPVQSSVRQCSTVTRYETRTIGYDVTYDYQGVRRHTQTATDPGDRIALNVNVSPADSAPAAPVYTAPPVAGVVPPPVFYPVQPAVVYSPPPVYAPRYVVNPWPVVGVGVGIGLGYRWGWHGGGYHHY